MKTSTAYNHYTRLKSKLESIYSAAECYCPHHTDLIAQTSEVFKSIPAKCPAWVKQGLSDYSQFRFNHIQRHLVVWLFKNDAGKFVDWHSLTKSEHDFYCQPDNKGCHVWIRETTGRGTLADKNHYESGATITRSFEITDKIF